MNNTRSNYWDNIKGLLIFLVVFTHILFQIQDVSADINHVVDFIYLFHMPAFVFISGYFGKGERSRGFESIARLAFLFFVFNSLSGFYYGFSSLLRPMYSYWYLLALIVWRLTAHRIAAFRRITLILMGIALFSGFYSSIDNTLASARIIGFYPFYMAGYLLGRDESDAFVVREYRRRFILGVGLAVLFAGLGMGALAVFEYQDSELQMGAYWSPMGAFGRIAIFILAFLAIYVLRCVSPDKAIPLLTMFGRNSLWIFILHRPFTIYISSFIKYFPVAPMFTISLLSSCVLCALFGNELISRRLNAFAGNGADILAGRGRGKFNFAKLVALGVAMWFVVIVVRGAYKSDDCQRLDNGEIGQRDVVYPAMTAERKTAFDNAFRITFSGDLILREDQVKRGWRGDRYDFAEVFEYAKPYISSADYAIGAFEGPMAGAEAGYSTSNFADGKEHRLNFPDEFAVAVKDAGFDLVTTANNHLLDKGEAGARRTLDQLDRVGLDHTGSYRSAKEKAASRIKLVECQGVRMAVLSYTYGSNYVDNNVLERGSLAYVTSMIGGTGGDRFEFLKGIVEKDFVEAKSRNPDLIVVLPHIGKQFSNFPDQEQMVWFDIFKRNGADIILGDHPHVVEPVVIEEFEGRTVFTAYCPGNFANVYRANQGYASMLVDVFIDRTSKKVIGGGIVPLFTHARADGNYRAVPIYSMVNDPKLRSQLTTDDLAFAAKANGEITSVVFGKSMDMASMPSRYYFGKDGFFRTKLGGLELTEAMRQGVLFRALSSADSICFVGDSVTEGTKNGGCGWYEPIEEHLDGKEVSCYAKGGCTVSYMVDRAADIPNVDLYVIALGANDVRYRDERTCAMTPECYIEKIDALRTQLLLKSPPARFVFIAPWLSTDGDPFSKLPYAMKVELNNEYAGALEEYCRKNGIPYVNANDAIRAEFEVSPCNKYLLDHIHPNASAGVLLYSKMVLLQ